MYKLRGKIEKIINYYSEQSRSSSECDACGKELLKHEDVCTECGSTDRTHKISILEGGSVNLEKVRNTTFVVIFILSIVFFRIWPYTFFSDNTLYWLFSAVLQSFAGLIAFLTAVIIFRLQINTNEINNLVEKLRKIMNHFLSYKADVITQRELLTSAVSATPENHPPSRSEAQQVQALLNKIKISQQSNNSVRKALKKSFNYNFVVIVSALMFLTLVQQITNLKLDISFTIFIIYWCVYSLITARSLLLLLR